jgi:hypothetical protein
VKINQAILTIENFTRLPNSGASNPRYDVTFTDGSTAITLSDEPCVYDVPNAQRDRKPRLISFTRSGRIRHIAQVK